MRNNAKKEVVISAKKYKAALKRSWWIVLCFAMIGMFVVALNVKKANKPVAVEETTQAETTAAVKYYGASANIYISATSDKMKNIVLFASAGDTLSKLNEKLNASGYDSINSTDSIGVSVYSGTYLTMAVYGKDSKARVEAIVKEWSDIIISMSKEKFGIVTMYVDGDITTFNAAKNGSSYSKIVGEIEEPTTQAVVKEEVSENTGVSIKSIVNVKNIVVIFVAIVGGFAVILVISVFDKKVYTRFEVEQLGSLTFLGDICDKGRMDIVTAGIASLVKDKKYGNILITTSIGADESEYMEMVKTKLQEAVGDVKVDVLPGIMDNKDTVSSLNSYDAAILYVVSGSDKAKDIGDALDEFDITGANLLGYIIA